MRAFVPCVNEQRAYKRIDENPFDQRQLFFLLTTIIFPVGLLIKKLTYG